MNALTINVKDYRDTLDQWVLLDVREDDEVNRDPVQLCPAVSLHIPVNEVQSRVDELDPDLPLVVICHHGVRSERVVEFLADLGYQALSLSGGTHALHEALEE